MCVAMGRRHLSVHVRVCVGSCWLLLIACQFVFAFYWLLFAWHFASKFLNFLSPHTRNKHAQCTHTHAHMHACVHVLIYSHTCVSCVHACACRICGICTRSVVVLLLSLYCRLCASISACYSALASLRAPVSASTPNPVPLPAHSPATVPIPLPLSLP